VDRDAIRVSGQGPLKAVDLIETLPYPGFPTDMQAQMMSMAAIAGGTTVIVENVFENRFRHAAELRRMGARITIKNRMAIVQGVPQLKGAQVSAWDLRAGAALVLAGLVAEGETVVTDVEYIDRGYERLEQALAGLGADIVRVY
jgi:UDP-N-acetylglucosamine 1-carboxyvinyltransferase